jgi:predicted nuclease of predicted toxin-antitoxin system
MKLLLDANLSPRLAATLTEAGYKVAHVADLGLLTAADATILDRAEANGFVVITADTDSPCCLPCDARRVPRSLCCAM